MHLGGGGGGRNQDLMEAALGAEGAANDLPPPPPPMQDSLPPLAPLVPPVARREFRPILDLAFRPPHNLDDDTAKHYCAFCDLDLFKQYGQVIRSNAAGILRIPVECLGTTCGPLQCAEMMFFQYQKNLRPALNDLYENPDKLEKDMPPLEGPLHSIWEEDNKPFYMPRAMFLYHFIWSPRGSPHVLDEEIGKRINAMKWNSVSQALYTSQIYSVELQEQEEEGSSSSEESEEDEDGQRRRRRKKKKRKRLVESCPQFNVSAIKAMMEVDLCRQKLANAAGMRR